MPTPTIDDVAAAAGVSKATVSRVLSGRFTHIRPETRQRVEAAIQSLGFRPSAVARSLSSRRTFTVGMLVSDVANPFYGDVIHGVEDQAISAGYNVLLANTNYDAVRGLGLIRSLVDRRADGVLVMSSNVSDDWLDELVISNTPAVVLDWAGRRIPGVSTIEVDFSPGIEEAAGLLLSFGHKRFAHVAGPLKMKTSCDRRDAYLKGLAAGGVRAEDVLIAMGDLTIDGGRKAWQLLSEQRRAPTAVFCANDLMALGVLSAARSDGLRVPGDLSIVGLDDIWLASQFDPPLTTVALPKYEIGVLAMDMLLGLLSGQEPERRVVSTSLVIRNSTGRP
jgi:DNA-binding LacI/PurR family transcriptional regulator